MSGIETGAEVVKDWCSEKASVEMGRAMRFRVEVRAAVLLMVRRW